MHTSQTFQVSQSNRRVQTKTQSESAYYSSWATLICAGFFGLTALMGVWAAYDQRIGLYRLLQMTVGFALLLGIPYICRENTRLRLALLGVACGALAAVLGIFVWFMGAGNSGALASSISVLLPLAIGGASVCQVKRDRIFAMAIVPIVIAGCGLIFSFERSAWFSLLIGLLSAACFFWISRKDSRWPTNWPFGLIVLIPALLLFSAFWVLVSWPSFVALLARLPMADSAASRVDLWQNSLTLVYDYPFTGSGLGVSAMIYSTYVYLLHVPYFYHAHELFLQIAVEQGLPGLIAFVGMLMMAFYGLLATHAWQGSTTLRLLYSATLGSLVTLVAYGLQDAEIYVQPTLPILFVPFGFTLALQWRLIRHYGTRHTSQMQWDGWLLVIAPWLLLVSMMVWPGSLAAMQADLGAVAQAKAELSLYRWPEWPIQDDLRRQHRINLDSAIRHYRSALVVNPDNATAYRRLGQIALAEGDVVSAEKNLLHTLTLDPQDRAAHQLLGEIYAISGRTDEAIAQWQKIDTAQGQLDVRVWWYTHIGAQREAALLTEAVQRLKENPVAGE